MGASGYEFGDRVGEAGEGIDVENGIGIFPVVHSSFGENDGYELDAGAPEEVGSGGFGKELRG
jgi:hypothetical protein